MKNLFIMCTCYMLMQSMNAQKIIEKHLDFNAKQSVDLQIQIADSIRIIVWNKNEVYVKASINIEDNKYNDDYSVDFNTESTNIGVSAKLNMEKVGSSKKSHSNCCCNTQIYWEIYMPENVSLTVETISADLMIAGKINKLTAKTISGFIDLTLPETQKADLEMKSISGTFYSNLLFNKDRKEGATPHLVEHLNGGGNPFQLETISGDIFLRKAE